MEVILLTIRIAFETIILKRWVLDYSEEKLRRILNAELADTLGNLLNRCCGDALNPEQIFPGVAEYGVVFNELASRVDVGKKLVESLTSLSGIFLFFFYFLFLFRFKRTLVGTYMGVMRKFILKVWVVTSTEFFDYTMRSYIRSSRIGYVSGCISQGFHAGEAADYFKASVRFNIQYATVAANISVLNSGITGLYCGVICMMYEYLSHSNLSILTKQWSFNIFHESRVYFVLLNIANLIFDFLGWRPTFGPPPRGSHSTDKLESKFFLMLSLANIEVHSWDTVEANVCGQITFSSQYIEGHHNFSGVLSIFHWWDRLFGG